MSISLDNVKFILQEMKLYPDDVERFKVLFDEAEKGTVLGFVKDQEISNYRTDTLPVLTEETIRRSVEEIESMASTSAPNPRPRDWRTEALENINFSTSTFDLSDTTNYFYTRP